MRSKSVLRPGSRPRWDRLAAPAVLGLASWLAFPAVPSQGDLTDLLAGVNGSSDSWRMVITQSPAGSLHTASLAFPGAADILGGDAGIALPDGRKVALVGKEKPAEATADEDRVNRGGKKGRVMAVQPMLPPKAFSAGSVLQRQSAITRPIEKNRELAGFVKPGKQQKEIELASFYFRKEETAPQTLPPMIANLVTNDEPDVLATAYAPVETDFSRQSPFDAILKKEPNAGRFIPPIGKDDHAWAATPLPELAFTPQEQQCLASGIYFEARGESVRGQAAVAQVILNRVRNPAYPGTICDVVYQNEDWRNRCQFSFACDNIKDRIRSEEHWKMAREVAMAVTAGKIWLTEVGSSTHYHAIYVRPKWARTMKKVGRIGLHVFYRTYGGGWS